LRLFIAAYPSAEAVAHLSAQLAQLALGRPAEPGRSLRLTRPDTWHVTLAFLGEVPDDRADAASGALLSVPIKIKMAGGGRFGRGKFTTVWAGLDGDVPALRELATDTRKALKRARLPFDRKPFRPHVTLARPGDRLPAEELARDLAVLGAYEGPQWSVDDVRLTRSHLGPDPVYETVAQAPPPRG
jgi:2'-5' RNA ligase